MKGLRKSALVLACALALSWCGKAVADYVALDGNGSLTTMGSLLTGGKNYVYHILVDGTTPTQVASVSAGGALKVDGSAVTQPVSGTVSIGNSPTVSISGTGAVELLDSGGTNKAAISAGGALKVDGSAVTQPVSGTVTANIGTSGSLALDASVTGLEVSQASTTSGQKGALVQCATTTAAPTYTTAQTDPLSCNTSGGLRVDGSGVTQPVSGTVSITANSAVNVAQINGVTPLMGNGVTGTGSHRVTISSDNSNSAGIGGSATGSTVPSAARYIGGNGSGNLTGITVCDTWVAINQTAGAQLITGVAAKKVYICSINLVTATAQNIALVGGTGTVCATTPHAIAGGTTAATGWNLAANGGLTQGSGVGVIMQSGTAADNVCLLQSSTGQVSGAISYTIF